MTALKKRDLRRKLAELIDLSGMERKDVAAYLGVNERTLYRWLSGDSRIPEAVILAMKLKV